VPKKKGWFSRWRKPSAGSSPAKVSRPPSGVSFASSQRKPAHATEDELPPRTQKEVSPDVVTPNVATGRSSTDIPKHAGFDLNAMQEIIGEAKLNHKELQVQKPTVPPTPPPTQRSESAPMLVLKLSVDVTSDLESGAAHYELTSQGSGSLEEPEIVVPSTHSQPVHQEGFEPALYPTLQLPLPSLPTVGDFQSSWATEPLTKTVSEVPGSRSLGPSTNASSLGNPDGATTPFGGWCTPPPSPFTDSSSSAVSLVFSSTDGSITSSPATEDEQDPWDSRLPPVKVAGTEALSHQDGLITDP